MFLEAGGGNFSEILGVLPHRDNSQLLPELFVVNTVQAPVAGFFPHLPQLQEYWLIACSGLFLLQCFPEWGFVEPSFPTAALQEHLTAVGCAPGHIDRESRPAQWSC